LLIETVPSQSLPPAVQVRLNTSLRYLRGPKQRPLWPQVSFTGKRCPLRRWRNIWGSAE